MNLPKPDPSTKLTEAMLDSDRYVAEEKLDGERVLLDGSRGAPRLLSSHGTDRSQAVPHLIRPHKLLEGTILDGEVVAPSGRFGDVVSTLHSGAARAQAHQLAHGFVQLRVFDVTQLSGTDVSRLPLHERRRALEQLVRKLRNQAITCVEQTRTEKREFYRRIVQAGGEGIVLKDRALMYGLGWTKMKHSADVSVVVTHVHTDRDAIELSAFDGMRFVSVGDCSVPTTELKAQLRTAPETVLGHVLDVSAFALTAGERLRNPVWLRLRPDLLPDECTLSKIRATLPSR